MATTTSQPAWLQTYTSTPPTKAKTALPDPPNYTRSTTVSRSKNAKQVVPRTEAEMDTLKLKKAWEVALAPAKQLPMNAIGMYMTGNSLQIFSIMMVFMLFKGPITAVMNINNTFSRFESESKKQELLLVKLAFIATNALALGLGIWKVNGMGLLPYVSRSHCCT
ncbi:hypothetical protein AMS68_005727 [Peltaster fructicola]|uniref:ER membrane protein complex subunit 4 n=1 Tax=Peltaster fructicola TaxID=286661 RepID=A0A6H0Y0N3_9PEZI|nr:hypothetical protein AMS68_005727 [Peltaster fructicola]